MKKSDPTSPSRPSSPRTPTATTDAKTRSDAGRNDAKAKAPTLTQPAKQKMATQKERTAPAEEDGSILQNYPEFDDESSDDEVTRAGIAHWEQKSQELVESFNAKDERSRNTQKKQASDAGIAPEKSSTVHVAGEKKEPATEPQRQKRSRAGTFRATLSDGMARLSRASMNHDTLQTTTLGKLAALPWTCDHPIDTDGNGFPVLDTMPPTLRQMLANEYAHFSNNKRYEGLSLDARDEQLKHTLAKSFLAFVLMDRTSQFKKEKIGAASEINRYLSRHFGVKIDTKLTPPATPGSAQTQRGAADFRDLLVQDALLHARHYRIVHSVDLRNMDADPFVRQVFDGTIKATQTNETVSKTVDQRTDVTATFQRDFPNSVYECESADGSVKPCKSVDEFVQFVGDPLKSGLPKQVSHFACQNTGIFIKNLLFTKTDAKGQPQSALKLFDDTPLAISLSPSARYRLKKAADGTVTLQYRSEIDTTGAGAQGRNTARLLVPGNEKSVLIENAHAVCTLDIAFHPDGTVRMDTLRFHAEGWNQISE